MGFEWDPAKNNANLQKHGIDFDYAIRIFEGIVLERVDSRKDYGETRFIAVGQVDERVLAVVYARRGAERRIISARSAHKNERKTYSEALAAITSRSREN